VIFGVKTSMFWRKNDMHAKTIFEKPITNLCQILISKQNNHKTNDQTSIYRDILSTKSNLFSFSYQTWE